MKLPNIIKRGNKGAAVRWVQQRLVVHGRKIAVDGDFGPKTEAALRAFQSEKRITVDGIAGPQSQAFLKVAKGKKPSNLKSPAALLPKPKPVQPPRLAMRLKMVRTMESWAGKQERPVGSNKVPDLVKLAKRTGWTTGVANMGFSWCSFGLHLALALNGAKSLKASGTWAGYTGMYVPNVKIELDKMVKAGTASKIAHRDITRGDILIMFKEGHIGAATARADSGRVKTIECNTSSGAGSQTNGDGCFPKVRTFAEIDVAYRIHES